MSKTQEQIEQTIDLLVRAATCGYTPEAYKLHQEAEKVWSGKSE